VARGGGSGYIRECPCVLTTVRERTGIRMYVWIDAKEGPRQVLEPYGRARRGVGCGKRLRWAAYLAMLLEAQLCARPQPNRLGRLGG
jgi:hypothetical protein